MELKTAKVIQNKVLSKNTFLMQLQSIQKMKVYPTQFIFLDTYPYKFLLKPFTIVEYRENILTLIYRTISDGTRFLSTLGKGNIIKFLGPFGNYKKITSLKIKSEDKIALIAGGSGIASIICLYNYFKNFTDNIQIFYGEQTKEYIINLKLFDIKNIVYTTDDGSYGNKGTVVEIFTNRYPLNVPNYVFLCGPVAMIETLYSNLRKFNSTKIYVLLEEYMCCGVGVCRSCIVKVRSKNKSVIKTVCQDGPTFELKNILFD
ncbi:MAG: hypothetical protein NZ928_02820 [Endomicrobia bacterium]|nr:hypothetical protein [Endomicrobiia bacterium]MCX7940204.1 hypothetical protein [Endomicrobiia bacterium]MDW8055890.1 hypothetical protein [Elusimicrobiota bacterium]